MKTNRTRGCFIYIVHPYRNDPEGNFQKVTAICKDIVAKHSDMVPLAPQLMLRHLIDENDQDLAFEMCRSLIKRCNEVWVYDDKSEGCQEDIKYAMSLRIPVILRC